MQGNTLLQHQVEEQRPAETQVEMRGVDQPSAGGGFGGQEEKILRERDHARHRTETATVQPTPTSAMLPPSSSRLSILLCAGKPKRSRSSSCATSWSCCNAAPRGHGCAGPTERSSP